MHPNNQSNQSFHSIFDIRYSKWKNLCNQGRKGNMKGNARSRYITVICYTICHRVKGNYDLVLFDRTPVRTDFISSFWSVDASPPTMHCLTDICNSKYSYTRSPNSAFPHFETVYFRKKMNSNCRIIIIKNKQVIFWL
jgi:hypothetical protein